MPGPRPEVYAVLVIGIVVGAGLGVARGFLLWGAASSSRPLVVVAIQPSEAAAEIVPRAQSLESFLEARVPADFEIYIPTTYAAVVEAIRFQNAHVALMSAWPSYLANKLADAEVVLAEVREVIIDEEKREEPFYFSYFVVTRDSPYGALADLQGKRACFPSPISTSGYVFPLGRMVELGLVTKPETGGVDPQTFFAEVTFGGGYGQCWDLLKRGQVDVAVLAGDVSESLYREVLAGTRVIEQQGPIPSHSVVFGNSLQEPLRSQILAALLELGQPEQRDLMRKLVSAIFVRFEATTTEAHLAGLSQALDESGLTFTERVG
jgi:phosphonate transport system substrate-binding protein